MFLLYIDARFRVMKSFLPTLAHALLSPRHCSDLSCYLAHIDIMAPSAILEAETAPSVDQLKLAQNTSSLRNPNVQFDAAKHLAFSPPSSVLTMKDLCLEPTELSPIATTDPFPLLSHEAVLQHRRDLFSKDVLR